MEQWKKDHRMEVMMVEPSMVFIDGTHIKASANKKELQKEQVQKAAKVYAEELRREVNEERAQLGKEPIEDSDDDDDAPPPTQEKTVSTTDPESRIYVKGEHEREAHTACDKRGVVLAVEVTAGNVHDSVAWDAVYKQVNQTVTPTFLAMDAAYKTPWIAKQILEHGQVPILPYTRPKGKKEGGVQLRREHGHK